VAAKRGAKQTRRRQEDLPRDAPGATVGVGGVDAVAPTTVAGVQRGTAVRQRLGPVEDDCAVASESASRDRGRRRWLTFVGLCLLVLSVVLAGCGQSGSAGNAAGGGATGGAGASRAGSGPAAGSKRHSARHGKSTAKTRSSARGAKAKRKVRAIAPSKASQATVARVDATSDATLVATQHQASVSAGAPSDAEVRKEVAEAAKDGLVLPTGNTSAAFVRSAAEASISDADAFSVGASIPVAAWNPGGRPIADWIVPVLQWASEHGWTGAVTSGYRTFVEQAELNAAGDFSAAAGTSNHESTAYPGGAVDVTNPSQLLAVLPGYPGRETLHGGVLGPVDPEHFSATGE
jgi:hypothetical protein